MPETLVLTTDELATVTAFADLPTTTLQWLLARGEPRAYAPDESNIAAGTTADFMMAVVRGGIPFYALWVLRRVGIPFGRVGIPFGQAGIINFRGVAGPDTFVPSLSRTAP